MAESAYTLSQAWSLVDSLLGPGESISSLTREWEYNNEFVPNQGFGRHWLDRWNVYAGDADDSDDYYGEGATEVEALLDLAAALMKDDFRHEFKNETA